MATKRDSSEKTKKKEKSGFEKTAEKQTRDDLFDDSFTLDSGDDDSDTSTGSSDTKD